MFSFTNKKVTDVWNFELDSMKKISKMADFQGTARLADVLLLVLELDMPWPR